MSTHTHSLYTSTTIHLYLYTKYPPPTHGWSISATDTNNLLYLLLLRKLLRSLRREPPVAGAAETYVVLSKYHFLEAGIDGDLGGLGRYLQVLRYTSVKLGLKFAFFFRQRGHIRYDTTRYEIHYTVSACVGWWRLALRCSHIRGLY